MAKGIKTGGRKEGTPNKTTKEIRNVLKSVIDNEIVNIETSLEGLTAKERLEFLIKLIPYVLPKVETVQYNLGEGIDWDL